MPKITLTQVGPRVCRGRLLAVGMAAVAAVTLAGCNGSDGDLDVPRPSASLPTGLPTSLPSGLPTSLPTAIPTALPTSLPGVGRVDTATGAEALRGTNIPPDFPIPPGATVKVGTTTGSRSTFTMEGVDSDAARAFYRQALPAAGYEITRDVGVAGIASSIEFRGKGVTGTIGAAGVGSANAIAVVFQKQ
ncbi:conserved hypothetical protein [Parafrankia sp. EAN1pec]|uniref:hypothetical protein n=1 Tax=Parafrankia sp. (strain EAN1pec) TaxID=298653 RepID=UPI0000544EA7|nr:conserved hypothetical protein [Frankia sp. EAN1pec]